MSSTPLYIAAFLVLAFSLYEWRRERRRRLETMFLNWTTNMTKSLNELDNPSDYGSAMLVTAAIMSSRDYRIAMSKHIEVLKELRTAVYSAQRRLGSPSEDFIPEEAYVHLFMVQDEGDLRTATAVQLVTRHEEREASWRAFKQAVTRWVRDSEEGKKEWQDSGESLSVERLDHHEPTLLMAMNEEGILDVGIVPLREWGLKNLNERLVDLPPATPPH